MKCCEKEMINNTDNYHCRICGKRIPKICPVCKSEVYINKDNVHCKNKACNVRKFF